jgi:trimethylamine:corrinoid methyltransferase-like protein
LSLSLTPTLTRHDVERIHQHSLDLLERVGIGGHYLTQRETRDFTRREYVPV